MSNDYFDYDAERVISLRLQDYDQYPDSSAGKVIRRPAIKTRYRQSGEFTDARNNRKSRTGAKAVKSKNI
jgi:hypothetical protein